MARDDRIGVEGCLNAGPQCPSSYSPAPETRITQKTRGGLTHTNGRSYPGILDVARSVLAELDLDVVLQRVLDAAQELTGARYAAVGVLNDDRTELARFLTRGIDEPSRAVIGSLPRGRGVLGALIADPVPLRLADVGEHPRSYGFPHGHPPMHSFLGVPIVIAGEPYGNLYLTEKGGGERVHTGRRGCGPRARRLRRSRDRPCPALHHGPPPAR